MLRGRTSRATVVACTRSTIAAVTVFRRASGAWGVRILVVVACKKHDVVLVNKGRLHKIIINARQAISKKHIVCCDRNRTCTYEIHKVPPE